MREILFRGKRLYNGEWVYGFYVHCADRWGRDKDLIQSLDIESGEFGFLHEVDPETVGQYTGLTDKNGTKIFEGDIVRHLNDDPFSEVEEKGLVFWDENTCGWRRTSNGAFHHGIVNTYRISPECLYEVIGNIHDNPELMGAQS